MNTTTIYAPGRWVDDIQSAMESWGIDFERSPDQCGPGIREVFAQYNDPARHVKRGRGYSWRFDLTGAGVRALYGEAEYRYEFHEQEGQYGNEYADAQARNAAKVLMDRCREALRAAQPEECADCGAWMNSKKIGRDRIARCYNCHRKGGK